jgi:FkbM family methyltransferase
MIIQVLKNLNLKRIYIINQMLKILFPDKNLSVLPKTSLNKKLSLLDVGARDGVGYPWNTAEIENLNVILVEPDPEEAELLRQHHQGDILPYALWSKETELWLNINNSPGTSSVLEANIPFLSQFDDSQRYELKNKIKISTRTIDNLHKSGELVDVDFMKIDIQGAEVEMMKGGVNFLKNNLVGLESEVLFTHLYHNQPLFSDIEVFVRQELGLELWDIRKTYWKYSQSRYTNPTKGRLIFGDALFLRPISTLDTWLLGMDSDKAKSKLHMLITVTLAYGYLDYADAILNVAFADKYLSKEDKQIFFDHIKKLHKSIYPFKNGKRRLYIPLQILANCFKPTHEGWASVDSTNHLGSRKKGSFWY